MMKRARRYRRIAVSLIETIMVIALLAAAAVTSSIMFDSQWHDRRGATDVTNEVADWLITARNTAITNQATVRVRRVRSGGAEQLVFREDPGPFRTGKNWTVSLGSDVRLRGSPREIQFRPTGSANRNLTWTIRRRRSSGQVTVAPASGQINRRLP